MCNVTPIIGGSYAASTFWCNVTHFFFQCTVTKQDFSQEIGSFARQQISVKRVLRHFHQYGLLITASATHNAAPMVDSTGRRVFNGVLNVEPERRNDATFSFQTNLYSVYSIMMVAYIFGVIVENACYQMHLTLLYCPISLFNVMEHHWIHVS